MHAFCTKLWGSVMCALYAISDSSFYDLAPALLSKPFYMIFSFCDDHKMKSYGIISPLKMELVPSVIETFLPSLSGVDVRCLGPYVDGTVGSESNSVCVCVRHFCLHCQVLT